MMPETDIRVALIGYGLGGAVFHAPLIAATPGMRLTSIVTRDPGRQAQARERYADAAIVERPEELWASPEAHDLVVVCTPNSLHVPLGLAALEAGLPVVVDKPLAATGDDGERLASSAAERSLMLSVFQNRRWDGDFLTVRRLLADSALGAITRFESRFERWKPEVNPDAWREEGAPEQAGGLLYDLGSHLIDQAMVLFGRPTHVYAEMDTRRPGANVDDDSFVALTHPNGVRSHLWFSAVARTLGPRMRVLGLEGSYEKHGLDPQEEQLSRGLRPGGEGWGLEPPESWGVVANGGEPRPLETEPGSYESYYQGVAEALRSGAPPPVEAADSVAGLRVIEAAVASARTGTVQRLDWSTT